MHLPQAAVMLLKGDPPNDRLPLRTAEQLQEKHGPQDMGVKMELNIGGLDQHFIRKALDPQILFPFCTTSSQP